MTSNKKMGEESAKAFWEHVLSNIKLITGEVKYKTEGSLQAQLTTFKELVQQKLTSLTAAAFAQMITSYPDLMANTVSGYLVDALAVKEGFDQINSNLTLHQMKNIAYSAWTEDDRFTMAATTRDGTIYYVDFYGYAPVGEIVFRRNTGSGSETLWGTNLTDSGWINLNEQIQYRKKNGYVSVRGSGVAVTTTFDTVATLPTGYRPSLGAVTAGVCGTYYAKTMEVFVGSDGSIRVQSSEAYNNGHFSIVYPI